MLASGQTFGSYLVDRPVGQGGMGAVFRARDMKLGRTVALKVMLDADKEDADSVARFLREAKLAAALEHPGIVRIYEVGTIAGTPYIAMEWIESTTLRNAKVADLRALLGEIAEVLAFAHDRGVVHRDLKPGNVMVDPNGRPKLVDFGIAKRLASATFATREGIVLGTPRYMAPEQELTSAVDARADQYAWGVIAYELLTGETPPRPAIAHAGLEARDSDVVMRALSPAPSDRFATMRDFLAAWRPPAPPPITAPAPTRSARLFVLSLLAAMALAALGTVVLVKTAPRAAAPTSIAPASIAPAVVAPPPSETAAPTASAEPSESAVPTPPPSAKRAPARRIVQKVDLYVSGAMNLDQDPAIAVMNTRAPALKRCLIGLPYREADPKLRVRVWLDDQGAVTSTTAALRSGSNDDRTAWPGADARICIERLMHKLTFTILGAGATFVLIFETK